MRKRAFAVSLAVPLLAVSSAQAADNEYLTPYTTTVDAAQAAVVAGSGIDLSEAGYDANQGGSQPIAGRDHAVATRPSSRARASTSPRRRCPRPTKSAAAADSSNPFASPDPYYTVFRSYSEKNGIADELRADAANNRDVAKLVQIGTSLLGKPILALKITANARNVADGSRPAVLYSATNHAREWITPEFDRRLATWFLTNKNDPKVAADPQHHRAVVPAGAERRRLRLHVHLRHRRGQHDLRRRARRTPTACGARRCATTTTTASTATAATASTRTATSRRTTRSTTRARTRAAAPRTTAGRTRTPSPRTPRMTG